MKPILLGGDCIPSIQGTIPRLTVQDRSSKTIHAHRILGDTVTCLIIDE